MGSRDIISTHVSAASPPASYDHTITKPKLFKKIKINNETKPNRELLYSELKLRY